MLLVSRGDEAIVVAAPTVGEPSATGVKDGDGIEMSVAKGVFVVAGGIVAVGAEAMPQSWASNSPFEAEYSDDSVEKFSESSGCLIVPSGQE
jgi:hypothetical protein